MLVVLEIKFEYGELWNVVEGLDEFGLWSSLCREWNLKNAERLSVCTKSSFSKLMEEMQAKTIKKTELEHRHESID